jgi:hypothetical protein
VRAAALPALLIALATAAADPPPQEVRLHLVLSRRPYGTEPERDRIRELEEEMLWLLDAPRAGELTRDRWEEGTCVIHLSAPDARRAWALIERAVRNLGPRPGSYAVIRTGAKGAPEERISLGPVPPPKEPPPAEPPPTPPP